MRRKLIPFVVAAALALPLMPATSAGAAPAAGSTAATTSQAPSAVAVPAKSKKTKKVKKVTIKTGRKKVHVNGTVKLNGKVKPKGKTHVAFEQKFPGKKKWRGAGAKVTKKSGKVGIRAQLTVKGTYKFRLATKKKTSKVVKVQATGKNPPVPPVPPAPPTTMDVTWPDGDPLEVDRQYDIPVQVKPAADVQVRLQQRTSGGWDDVYGGTANTGNDGSARVIMSIPDTGSDDFRVDVTSLQLRSDTVTKSFEDGGDTLYNIPINLPNKQGVIVKAQEYPMTYPKVPLPNPLEPGKSLILPQIGKPAAGPPDCVTNPDIQRSDCKIPGRQYRFMYTTERWYPNTDGSGSVQGGSQGATGLLMVPPNVQKNAPVVAWAHPTLGQANQCSISRGTSNVQIVDGKTGKVTSGPGGMDMGLIDIVFFLDQMLSAGYIVVMPDYLGIAVNGPTANQKTYVVGPQEARDVFYAVDALQSDAKNDKGWPGLPEAGNEFTVMGHSQGGHSALWTGIMADQLGPQTNQKLNGVVAVAPATDINKLVDVQWDQQANWVIGPEVIQTWAGYMGAWAFQNITVSNEAIQNLGKYEDLCTTQAFAQSNEFFPNGADQPGTPFMLDPSDPANQQSFYNWSRIFGKMTPVIDKNQSNSYPKDMPLELVSGTADQIVLSQANAAMQESFCSANANMTAFWTPVVTGVANSNPPATDSYQAADHLNVMAFPWTNKVGSDYQLSAGSLLQFAADRIAGKPLQSNCADRQTTHKNLAGVNTWYVFPAGADMTKPAFYEAGGQAALPAPAKPNMTDGTTALNPPPALGKIKFETVFGKQVPVNDTGCGTQAIGLKANPACTQWGLYPYGQLIYDDAKVGKTWGTYPYVPPKP